MSGKTQKRLADWQQLCLRMTPVVAAMLLEGCTGGVASWIPGRGAFHNSNGNPLYCRELDDCLTAHQARKMARICVLHYQDQCSEKLTVDFVYGFEQAFVDVAQGGWGMTPVVPPRKYWGANFRSGSGKQRACQWLAGYTAGAEQARYQLGDAGLVATSETCGPGCRCSACVPGK